MSLSELRPSPSPLDEPAVRTEGLVKRFGERVAVDGIDLVVARGTVYGLLGPNGAGKTTTVRMLATLAKPDGGSARVLGHDIVSEPERVRRRISLTGQFASVDEDLTGLENLVVVGRLLGASHRTARERGLELLAAFELDEVAGAQVKTYSGGMRRRLDIAASLVQRPDLLFLDEPTTGLDPRSRNEVWALIRALTSQGTTVLLTTQYLEEADQLADRMAVIDRGRVIAEGTSAELKASVGRGVLHVRLTSAAERERARALLEPRFGATRDGADPRALALHGAEPARAVAALDELLRAGVTPSDFSLAQPSLDEVFFAFTGRAAADEATPEVDRGP